MSKPNSGNLRKWNLGPLQPLYLPENSIVEIDARDVSEKDENESANRFKIEVFEEWMANLYPNTTNLTCKQINLESIYEEQLNRQREIFNCEPFYKFSPRILKDFSSNPSTKF